MTKPKRSQLQKLTIHIKWFLSRYESYQIFNAQYAEQHYLNNQF